MEQRNAIQVCLSDNERGLRYHMIFTLDTGVIFSTFQGELRMETQQVVVRPEEGPNHRPQFDIDRGMFLKHSTSIRQLKTRIRYENYNITLSVSVSGSSPATIVSRFCREKHYSPSQFGLCSIKV